MEDSNNNTNLKSQLDTIKHDFHKFLKQSAQDAKETLTSFLKKTERKVDAILAQVDMSHELYKGLILIKAYCVLRILLALLMTDSQKFVRTAEPLLIECETVLKPYKNRAEGVWLYVKFTWTMCTTIWTNLGGLMRYFFVMTARETNSRRA